MEPRGLTEKQKRFCDFYIETGNATEAARRAGYKKPNRQGPRMLSNVGIQKALYNRTKQLENSRIADAREVMEFLSRSMRGDLKEDVVVVEGDGEGTSTARILKKQIGAKDRIKAAELLTKRYGLNLPDGVDSNGEGVQIIDDTDQTV